MAFFFKTKAERNNLKFYIEWQKKNPITQSNPQEEQQKAGGITHS